MQLMGSRDVLFISLLLFSLRSLSCHSNSPLLTHPFNSHVVDVASHAIDDRVSRPRRRPKVFNVDDFGAKGKGNGDREAFMRAWEEACNSHVPSIYLVPKNKTYLLKPLNFYGPCKSSVTIMIMGTVEASSNISDWGDDDDNNNNNNNAATHWILFNNITKLAIKGGGTIIGNGEIWWKNSCKINKHLPCTVAPTALTFFSCNGLRIENLNIKNSQKIHVSIEQCRNVSISNVMITAPENSPNTDGIHVSNSNNIHINGCVIRTGDDCISIASGSQNVWVMNIVCGPGHGISIGSLGANKSLAKVSNIIVDNVALDGTTNGVRIKTWQGGQGHARNIVFQNIIMNNVYNPIIIDQNYCDSLNPCHEQKSAVSISRVIYKNITGISASKVAMKLSCSESLPCKKIKMKNIRLVGKGGKSTKCLCNHVMLTSSEMVVPPLCA